VYLARVLWTDPPIGALIAAFVTNPDKSRPDIPSHEQVRRAWNVVNAEFISRNRFAILLSRTDHLSYHLGQAVLGLK
jgi:hypothetical protein